MRGLDFATSGDEDAVPVFWGNDLHNTHIRSLFKVLSEHVQKLCSLPTCGFREGF